MLTWRTEAEGMFIVGSAEDHGSEVVFTTDNKELMYVSRGLTPDEFRRVADKLEELQVTKKEETGKVLWLRKAGKRGNTDIHHVYDTADVSIGYFYFSYERDAEVFTQTVGRGLSSAEVAAIKHFEKRLNRKL